MTLQFEICSLVQCLTDRRLASHCGVWTSISEDMSGQKDLSGKPDILPPHYRNIQAALSSAYYLVRVETRDPPPLKAPSSGTAAFAVQGVTFS